MKTVASLVVVVSLSMLALAGCRVTEHKNGDKANVSIATPFGSMQVKTDNDDATMTGLSVYPGAVPVKDNDHTHDSADINMNFGDFHLGVKAASYQTGDPVDKVLAFYRKDMARYGDVIECQKDRPVGSPSRTSQGLTCDDSSHNSVHEKAHTDEKNELELRAGSERTQHIVSVEPKDGGTKIGLVLLNLPGGTKSHDASDAE